MTKTDVSDEEVEPRASEPVLSLRRRLARSVTGWAPIAYPDYTDLTTRWPLGTRTILSPKAAAIGAIVLGLAVASVTGLPFVAVLAVAAVVALCLWAAISWLVPQGTVTWLPLEHVPVGSWVTESADWLMHASAATAVFIHHGSHSSPFHLALSNGEALHGQPDTAVLVVTISDPWRNVRAQASARDESSTIDDSDLHYAIVEMLAERAATRDRHGVDALPESFVTGRLEADWELSHDEAVLAIAGAERIGFIRRGGIGHRRELHLSEAGYVWYWQASRENGIEVLLDAARKEEGVVINIDNSGSIGSPVIAQGGSGNQAFVQQGSGNSATVEFHNEVQTLLSAARIVEERWDVLTSDLSPEAVEELGHALQVIRDSEGPVSVERRGMLRQAAGSLVRLCGQLILGAGGNGLYEALKAIAGL